MCYAVVSHTQRLMNRRTAAVDHITIPYTSAVGPQSADDRLTHRDWLRLLRDFHKNTIRFQLTQKYFQVKVNIEFMLVIKLCELTAYYMKTGYGNRKYIFLNNTSAIQYSASGWHLECTQIN
jgi:hypothetical protein